MGSRVEWGVRLFLAGTGLGMALMSFVVLFSGTSFYQGLIAPTATEAMRPLGYALDGAILGSFAMAVAGIACVPSRPEGVRVAVSEPRVSARDKLGELRQKKAERARKARANAASHGST